MSIETGNNYLESRDRERSEEERKLEIARQLQFSKEKNILLERIEKDKKMACLRSLVERGLIPLSTVERVVDGDALNMSDVQEIFEKIDEIEEIQDIDTILPQSLRITKEDYLSAIDDHAMRTSVLGRIDDALGYLYASSHASFAGVMQFFSSLFQSLQTRKDRSVTVVQGNMIDIKRNLKKR